MAKWPSGTAGSTSATRCIARRDHEIAALQQQLARDCSSDVQRPRAISWPRRERRARRSRELHERDLRSMLTRLQARQLDRDAEIMGTLGAVLSRHAPGAPASIYYRWLVAKCDDCVEH